MIIVILLTECFLDMPTRYVYDCWVDYILFTQLLYSHYFYFMLLFFIFLHDLFTAAFYHLYFIQYMNVRLLSVCLSGACDVGTRYADGWTFRQCICTT